MSRKQVLGRQSFDLRPTVGTRSNSNPLGMRRLGSSVPAQARTSIEKEHNRPSGIGLTASTVAVHADDLSS